MYAACLKRKEDKHVMRRQKNVCHPKQSETEAEKDTTFNTQ